MRRRAVRQVVVAVAVACTVLASVPAVAGSGSANRFREVARLPLVGAPEVAPSEVERSGWLILNPSTRRGYQVFETATLNTEPRTIVQSFDLDTLQSRARVVLPGTPITAGVADVAQASFTNNAGEIVHAVDREHGRLYLAMSQAHRLEEQPRLLVGAFGSPPDGQRPLDRFVAIDEAALDRGDAAFASFLEPSEQLRLHEYWVVGMSVTRHHVDAAEPGRLLVLFAQPQVGGTATPMPVSDHTLVQWDVGGLRFGSPDEDIQPAGADGPAVRVEGCSGGPLASVEAQGQGSYQWGLLATGDAVWTACSPAVPTVVRIGVDETGHLLPAGQQQFPIGDKVSDVLVDEGRARLLVRSFLGGTRVRAFDTATQQVDGVLSVKETEQYSVAFGVNSVTGRLYALLPDHARFVGDVELPVQGGLQSSDPPAALANVRPDLAYPALYAMRVDPVTQRVFVRRGHPVHFETSVYPGTQPTKLAPVEPFYRVFEDRVK